MRKNKSKRVCTPIVDDLKNMSEEIHFMKQNIDKNSYLFYDFIKNQWDFSLENKELRHLSPGLLIGISDTYFLCRCAQTYYKAITENQANQVTHIKNEFYQYASRALRARTRILRIFDKIKEKNNGV